MKNRILITLLFIGMEARASQTFQSLEAAARAKQAKLAESLAETAEGEAQKLITEARELLQSSQHMSGISLDKKRTRQFASMAQKLAEFRDETPELGIKGMGMVNRLKTLEVKLRNRVEEFSGTKMQQESTLLPFNLDEADGQQSK